MHIGRSHHTALETAVAVVGGFVASFLTVAVTTYTQYYSTGMQGQLLAGDQAANRDMPTTLNAMRSIGDGSNPILNSMTQFSWWCAVAIGAIIASFIILKLMRRYV